MFAAQAAALLAFLVLAGTTYQVLQPLWNGIALHGQVDS
jgi:hypothetical protein